MPKGRGNIINLKYKDKNFCIDDSYNSNPASLIASLKNFQIKVFGTKILVLGDMLELGKESKVIHEELGKN